jgi:hypothetical protein
MNCLLLGGAESVGKSSAIFEIAYFLHHSKGYHITAGTLPSTPIDFRVVLEGNNSQNKHVRIIINSATDTTKIINDFKKFYTLNGNYDILISSVRDDGFRTRTIFFKIMGIGLPKDFILEIPLGKVRRGSRRTTAITWYTEKLKTLSEHILVYPPFNL